MLAIMILLTCVCLGRLFYKLYQRWQHDRQLRHEEDDFGASILRLESNLRRSFRECCYLLLTS